MVPIVQSGQNTGTHGGIGWTWWGRGCQCIIVGQNRAPQVKVGQKNGADSSIRSEYRYSRWNWVDLVGKRLPVYNSWTE